MTNTKDCIMIIHVLYYASFGTYVTPHSYSLVIGVVTLAQDTALRVLMSALRSH